MSPEKKNKMGKDPEHNLQVLLEERLKEKGVWYRFVEKPEATVHTADAADVSGIPLKRISKNLMARTRDGRDAALIIPGDAKVDYKAAAEVLKTKSIGLVPFDKAHTLSGFPPGGTPSIGFNKRLDVVLDAELANQDTFFCGGGSTRQLLELKPDDVDRKSVVRERV